MVTIKFQNGAAKIYQIGRILKDWNIPNRYETTLRTKEIHMKDEEEAMYLGCELENIGCKCEIK